MFANIPDLEDVRMDIWHKHKTCHVLLIFQKGNFSHLIVAEPVLKTN